MYAGANWALLLRPLFVSEHIICLILSLGHFWIIQVKSILFSILWSILSVPVYSVEWKHLPENFFFFDFLFPRFISLSCNLLWKFEEVLSFLHFKIFDGEWNFSTFPPSLQISLFPFPRGKKSKSYQQYLIHILMKRVVILHKKMKNFFIFTPTLIAN